MVMSVKLLNVSEVIKLKVTFNVKTYKNYCFGSGIKPLLAKETEGIIGR